MLIAFAFAAFFSVAIGEDKRVVDSSRISIRGGGKIDKSQRFGATPDTLLEETLLLQVESSSPLHLEPAYSFLANPKYAACYEDDEKGQGDECNSCWAFAVKNMIQARKCKKHIEENKPWTKSDKLSALNMICNLQSGGFCATRGVYESLDFAKKTGLVKLDWLKETVNGGWSPSTGGNSRVMTTTVGFTGMGRGLRALTGGRARLGFAAAAATRTREPWALIDVSNPLKVFCEYVFADVSHEKNLEKITSVTFSAAPYSSLTLKKYLAFGPVVGTIRLSWEFLNFNGTLFDPRTRMTFCRSFKEKDRNDYCNPAIRSEWDSEQLAQQATSADEDTWYNHFVTIHGWGVAKGAGASGEDVPYWVVENSWGRIYKNDPSLDNNGAGSNYRTMAEYSDIEKKKSMVNRNHFLLIANQAAGRGGLEMTSREVYTVRL